MLMGTGSPTVDAVQRKTQVGRGTVQRIKEGSTSTGTDTLLAIADAFGVEPWELLRPQLGKQTANLGANKATPPTLAQALEVVAGALYAADDLTIDQVRPLLSRLVDEPSRAAEIVPRLSALLSSNSGAAIETAAFAGKPKSAVASSQPVSAGEFVKR